jgi:hypothetical protein
MPSEAVEGEDGEDGELPKLCCMTLLTNRSQNRIQRGPSRGSEFVNRADTHHQRCGSTFKERGTSWQVAWRGTAQRPAGSWRFCNPLSCRVRESAIRSCRRRPRH